MADATLAAFEELYRRRYGRFLRLARAVTGDAEAASDAVQEGFARAIRGRFDFRGEGSLEGWVWRAVLNCALSQQRRVRAEHLADAAEPSRNGQAEEAPDLRAAVAALPERQRTVLFLRHYADLDYDTIGEVLAIARGTVAATLHAAHSTLRRTMEEVPR